MALREAKKTEEKSSDTSMENYPSWHGATEFLGCVLPRPGVAGKWWNGPGTQGKPEANRAGRLWDWWSCPALALAVSDILTIDPGKRFRRALASIVTGDDAEDRSPDPAWRRTPGKSVQRPGQISRAQALAERWDQARLKAEALYRGNVTSEDILFSWKTLLVALDSGLLPVWLRFPPTLIPPGGYTEVLPQRKTNADRERSAEDVGRWMHPGKTPRDFQDGHHIPSNAKITGPGTSPGEAQ